MHGALYALVSGMAVCPDGCIFPRWPSANEFQSHIHSCPRATSGPVLWRTGTSESLKDAVLRKGVFTIGQIMGRPCTVKMIYNDRGMPTHVAPESMRGIHAVCVKVSVKIEIQSHAFSVVHAMYSTLWPAMDSESGARARLSPSISVAVQCPVVVTVVDIALVCNAVTQGTLPVETFVGLLPSVWRVASHSRCVQSRLSCIMPNVHAAMDNTNTIVPAGSQHTIETSTCTLSSANIAPPEYYSCNGDVFCGSCCKQYSGLDEFFKECGVDAVRCTV